MTMTRDSDSHGDGSDGDRDDEHDELQGTPGLEEPDETLPDPPWRTPPTELVEGVRRRVEHAVGLDERRKPDEDARVRYE